MSNIQIIGNKIQIILQIFFHFSYLFQEILRTRPLDEELR